MFGCCGIECDWIWDFWLRFFDGLFFLLPWKKISLNSKDRPTCIHLTTRTLLRVASACRNRTALFVETEILFVMWWWLDIERLLRRRALSPKYQLQLYPHLHLHFQPVHTHQRRPRETDTESSSCQCNLLTPNKTIVIRIEPTTKPLSSSWEIRNQQKQQQ